MTSDDDDLKDLPAHIYGERRYFLPEWRKRRQKQIDDAVAIINPRPLQREACREDVERESLRLFTGVGMMITVDLAKTKEGKIVLGKLATVLRRLQSRARRSASRRCRRCCDRDTSYLTGTNRGCRQLLRGAATRAKRQARCGRTQRQSAGPCIARMRC